MTTEIPTTIQIAIEVLATKGVKITFGDGLCDRPLLEGKYGKYFSFAHRGKTSESLTVGENGFIASRGNMSNMFAACIKEELERRESLLVSDNAARFHAAMRELNGEKAVYNRSQIMRRSWVLRRAGMSASDALKQAWKEAKANN